MSSLPKTNNKKMSKAKLKFKSLNMDINVSRRTEDSKFNQSRSESKKKTDPKKSSSSTSSNNQAFYDQMLFILTSQHNPVEPFTSETKWCSENILFSGEI